MAPPIATVSVPVADASVPKARASSPVAVAVPTATAPLPSALAVPLTAVVSLSKLTRAPHWFVASAVIGLSHALPTTKLLTTARRNKSPVTFIPDCDLFLL